MSIHLPKWLFVSLVAWYMIVRYPYFVAGVMEIKSDIAWVLNR